MPPKADKDSTLTRSQSREQGLDLQWSRQLGGSVEVSSKDLDVDSQTGNTEVPVDIDSAATDNLEIEVEVSSSEDTDVEEVDKADQGSRSSLEWDNYNSPDLGSPLLSANNHSLRRLDSDSIFASEASSPDRQDNAQRLWSISVN